MSEGNPLADLEKLRFSPVRDDLLIRLQRAVGLAPVNGLGVIRRALFWSLLAWLPVAAWAWHAGRVLPGTLAEPLLSHFGVQVRLLIAVPLLILAEGLAHALCLQLLPYFASAGLVRPADLPRLQGVLDDATRLARSNLPWLVILALVAGLTAVMPPDASLHELSWAVEGDATSHHLDGGGWWMVYVGRSIFLSLLLGWLWRLALVFEVLRRIARLPLALVPSHPDRAAGLAFLARLPLMFAPVVLAVGSVLAAGWAHDVVYHGAHVAALRWEMAAFAVSVLLLFLSPLFVFATPISRAKKQALLQYGALVGRHGRLVHAKWIAGQPVADEPVLDAPELGPVADVGAIYDAVAATSPATLFKKALPPLLLAAVVPMVVVLAIEVPVVQVLKKLLGALA